MQLCDCECPVNTKVQTLGNYFIKLDELDRIPVEGPIRLIRIEDWKMGMHTRLNGLSAWS